MIQLAEQIPDQARRVLISVNPRAGARDRSDLIARLSELLRAGGLSVATVEDWDELERLSGEAMADADLRAVIAAGGDGTVSAVANHLPSGVPIMVLPLGTENLLAKYLSIGPQAKALSETVLAGYTIRFDAGLADGKLFLLMLSCGFDAEVVRRLHSERTGHINHFSYAKPILDSLRTYDYPRLRVRHWSTADRSGSEIDCRWVFVTNLPKYAGGLSLVPDAVGTDGLLDVCTFKEGSILHGLRYLTGVVFGQHQAWDDCTTVQTDRVRIEADGDVPYQLDGDPGGFLPVDVQVLPGRLTIVVSENWARQHGFALSRSA